MIHRSTRCLTNLVRVNRYLRAFTSEASAQTAEFEILNVVSEPEPAKPDVFQMGQSSMAEMGQTSMPETMAGPEDIVGQISIPNTPAPTILRDAQPGHSGIWHPGQDQSKFNVDDTVDLQIGIICLDSVYQKNIGDLEHEGTFDLPTHRYHIPGLTFEACKTAEWNYELEQHFEEAIEHFEKNNCAVITGNCGFMAHYQYAIADMTNLPVVMSSLVYLPLLGTFYNTSERIAIVTANGKKLKRTMRRILLELFGYEISPTLLSQCKIIGLEDIEYFGHEVEEGRKVDYHESQVNILEHLVEMNKKYDFKCFLMECTQAPQFSDAIRWQFQVPVFDIITLVDAMIAGKRPNKGFGDYRQIL